MALSQRLDFRQSQNLVLTPQLQQAIKLLQLNNMELTEYVEGELEQNPLLERSDSDGPATLEAVERDNLLRHDSDDKAPVKQDGDGFGDAPSGPDTVEQRRPTGFWRGDDPRDVDYGNEYASAGIDETDGVAAYGAGAGDLGNWKTTGAGGRLGETDETSFEARLAATTSLRDHLLEQLSMEILEPMPRLIAAHLIDMIDPAGYLSEDWPSIAETLGCSSEDVDAVIDRLQRFDPAGVCASR